MNHKSFNLLDWVGHGSRVFFSGILIMSGFFFIAGQAQAVFDTGGASGQNFWDMYFTDPTGAGFGNGGTVTVGGYTFDPVAAARALLLGMWDDINFINMLKAYAITNPNAYSSTNPQMNMQTLLNFVNTVASGAVGIAQNQMSDDDIAKEGENFDNTIFSNELDNAYKAAVASTQYEMAHQASLEKWLTDVKNGGTEVYNKEFGLIYDKKSGTVYYANSTDINNDGVADASKLQAVAATQYIKTGTWSAPTTKTTAGIPTTSGGASIDASAYGKLTAAQKAVVDQFISTHPGAGLGSDGKLYWMVDGVKYAMGGPNGNTDLTVANETLMGDRVLSDDGSACVEAFGADSWLSDGADSSETGHTAGPGSGNGSTGTNIGTNTGSGCSSDSDCASGQTCQNGTCKAVLTTTSTSCSSDSDCASGQTCQNGTCKAALTTTSTSCSSDSDCASGKTCQNGTCKAVAEIVPIITNTTGSNQIKSTFNLTVTTNRSAGCQYKQGAPFTYGNGSTFDTTGETSHSAKLYSLTTGSYTYYVVCKDIATGGVSAATTVSVNVDLALDDNNKPVISNNTDATLTSAISTLAVNTDRPAKCEFNKGSGFTFGNGTGFSTTGGYSHNNDLIGLANGNYAYYVVCQDAATKAVSNAFKISFTVDLSSGADNAPHVSNVTASTQTEAAPVLAVTTDLPSVCRYSTTAGFAFDSGSLLTTGNGYAHNVSIAALTDATYTFYVVCKSNATNAASSQLAVTTTIDRPEAVNDQPKITIDTMAYQTASPATISIKTEKAANCQYSTGNFTWGSGMAFTTTGSITHSVAFSGLENGQHSYYVVCRDLASGEYNSTATQVIFTLDIDNRASSCANLVSNDRVNDSDRSALGSGKNDSSYLWQAVENGTREKFDQVDWFAGYQFSVGEDGTASELCGYFTKGEKNNVTLFNGSYKALATAEVTGTEDWACVKIDPVSLQADARYYVITKINNQSIYYEYKSGFLPVDTGKAVIEAGIRQSVNSTFNKDIVKYDYMIFGLVDVKVSYNPESSQGPDITSTSPSGTIHDSSAFLSVETDKGATCKFGRDDVDFDDMGYALPEINDGMYSQLVCNLDEGDFTFYVRCKKNGDANDASKPIKFTVSN